MTNEINAEIVKLNRRLSDYEEYLKKEMRTDYMVKNQFTRPGF